MKQILLSIGCLLLFIPILQAQQTLSQTDMTAITPMVSEEMNFPSGVKAILENKARQMLTMNGLASTSGRFILTPNITVITKDVTPTTPPMFSMNIEVSFFVVDAFDQVIISEITYPSKGIDRQEHKALIQAINKFNIRAPQVTEFIEDTKNRIADYYKMRIPAMIKKAETLASQGFYEDALALLSDVPESVEGYPTVAKKIVVIHKEYANHEADKLLSQAKGLIATRDYSAAMEVLAAVDPLSDRYKNATALVDQVKASINASERAAIANQMQRYEDKKEEAQRNHDDQVALQKMAITAARDIAIANNETKKPSLMKSLNSWFIAKFK